MAECPPDPLWYDPDTFVVDTGSTLDEATDAIAEATWVLWSLTGRRLHQAECRQDVYMNRQGMCVLELEHYPVDEVFSVSRDIDGVVTELTTWRHIRGQKVRLCCTDQTHYPGLVEACHTCTDSHIVVDYRVGSNLPPGAARVTKRLAMEFYRSTTGAPCNLPERITSVNRQGVSWTILDPLDFLDKGLTGIGAVDSWVTAVNGRGVARMIDPLVRSPLVESTLLSCGEDCEPDE